jgi:hypothetical protein
VSVCGIISGHKERKGVRRGLDAILYYVLTLVR